MFDDGVQQNLTQRLRLFKHYLVVAHDLFVVGLLQLSAKNIIFQPGLMRAKDAWG